MKKGSVTPQMLIKVRTALGEKQRASQEVVQELIGKVRATGNSAIAKCIRKMVHRDWERRKDISGTIQEPSMTKKVIEDPNVQEPSMTKKVIEDPNVPEKLEDYERTVRLRTARRK